MIPSSPESAQAFVVDIRDDDPPPVRVGVKRAALFWLLGILGGAVFACALMTCTPPKAPTRSLPLCWHVYGARCVTIGD